MPRRCSSTPSGLRRSRWWRRSLQSKLQRSHCSSGRWRRSRRARERPARRTRGASPIMAVSPGPAMCAGSRRARNTTAWRRESAERCVIPALGGIARGAIFIATQLAGERHGRTPTHRGDRPTGSGDLRARHPRPGRGRPPRRVCRHRQSTADAGLSQRVCSRPPASSGHDTPTSSTCGASGLATGRCVTLGVGPCGALSDRGRGERCLRGSAAPHRTRPGRSSTRERSCRRHGLQRVPDAAARAYGRTRPPLRHQRRGDPGRRQHDQFRHPRGDS